MVYPKPVDDAPALSELIGSFQRANLEDNLPSQWIDSPDSIARLVDTMIDLPIEPPSLYLDLEGVKLSRHGTISILQVFVLPQACTYLINIHSLGQEAFRTAGTKNRSLKSILESKVIPKVFFDVRNDSDALYAHFEIGLACIQDIQLMELATRTFSKMHVNGLSRCIERDAVMTPSEKKCWTSVKEEGLKMFAPEHGGSHEVFDVRPLAENIRAYCVQDVQFMPRLWAAYHCRLTPRLASKVDKATKDRVTLSQSKTYISHGPHKALGPWPVSGSAKRGRKQNG